MRKVRVAAAATLATSMLLALAPGAQAQRPASLGAGAPVGQSGIQLYNFSSYLSNGAGEILCPASPRRRRRTASGRSRRRRRWRGWSGCSRSCRRAGSRTSSCYGYPGNPFPSASAPNGDAQGALELRALGDEYGIRFPARHGSLNEARWDAEIDISRILGQDHVGESGPGGAGGVGSYQRRCARRAAQQARQALGGARPRPGVLPQPRGRVRRHAALPGQRRD